MNLLVQIPVQEIEKKLNSQLGEVLHESGFGPSDEAVMQVRVRRRSPLKVSTADNSLLISAPVHVWTHQGKSSDMRDFWKDIPMVDIEEIDFELTAHFRINLSLSSNWELKGQVQSEFDWDRKPRIGIGLIKFNVTRVVGPILEKELEQVAKRIQRFIEQELALPTYIQAAWEALEAIHQVEETLPLHLALCPEPASLTASPLVCHQNMIQLIVGLPIHPVVQLGPSLAPPAIRPLPSFRPHPELPLLTESRASGILPYKALSSLYAGESFSFRNGKTQLILEQIQFDPQGAELHLDLHFQGQSKWLLGTRKHRGILHISGIPQASLSTQQIVFQNLTHKWSGWDSLVRLLFRAYRKNITSQLQLYVDQLLANSVASAEVALRESLTGNPLTEQVQLRGKLELFTPTEVMLHPDHIQIIALAKGNLLVQIGNF